MITLSLVTYVPIVCIAIVRKIFSSEMRFKNIFRLLSVKSKVVRDRLLFTRYTEYENVMVYW